MFHALKPYPLGLQQLKIHIVMRRAATVATTG
jgi:hypothetical protein